ncbi:hypothetical protein ACLFMI_20715 [Pseudonocardia nantongensis]|uniref:hypothetical protein n=1 Tax=Pseudonocardia nantongensis TaxID=1181885 RepID=UPI00397C4427
MLESTGVNDDAIRRDHGDAGVFAFVDRHFDEAGPWGPYESAAWIEPERREATADAVPGGVRTRWFWLRGLLYAVPAVVAFTLLPAADHVESGLLLGALLLSWAGGYGMTYVAWGYIGHHDLPAAHRFLRLSVLVGTGAAVVVAVLAVYASLMVTVTMQVSLWTVLLLVGQTVYLLSAATVLMTGHELRLLVALLPAVGGSVYYTVFGGAARPAESSFAATPAHGPEALFLAATVVLTALFAFHATGNGRRPTNHLVAGSVLAALSHSAYGLTVGLLVLFPALNELLNNNFESLPLTVTVAALPLVVSMGVAEILLHEHRRKVVGMLRATGSVERFLQQSRREYLELTARFIAALVIMTVALGGVGAALFGITDARYLWLGGAYALLGTAIFAAMILNSLGRIRFVLGVLAAGVTVMMVFSAAADHTVPDVVAIACLAVVAASAAAGLGVAAYRAVCEAANHR